MANISGNKKMFSIAGAAASGVAASGRIHPGMTKKISAFDRLSPAAAGIVLQPGVVTSVRKAVGILSKAPAPCVVPAAAKPAGKSVAGARFAPAKLSNRDEAIGFKYIEQARKAIEKALEDIDREARKRRQSPVYITLLIASVVLIVVGVAAVLWGVFQGSQIELIGKDGAASFIIIMGFTVLGWMLRTDWQLGTVTSIVRARLSSCYMLQDYKKRYVCFNDALQHLNRGIEKLRLHLP